MFHSYGKFVHVESVDQELRFVFAEWKHEPGVGWTCGHGKSISLTEVQFMQLVSMVLQGRTDVNEVSYKRDCL